MPTPPLTDEQALEAVEAYRAAGTITAAAKLLGLSAGATRNRLFVASQRNLTGDSPGGPLPLGQVVAGTSTLYDGEGNASLTWVKTRTDKASTAFYDAATEFFDQYKGLSAELPSKPPETYDDQTLVIYPIADLHLGMYAWGEETDDDYDSEIAEQTLKTAATNLVSRSPSSDECVILQIGDFFHADDTRNATPASGHVLDVDTRYIRVMKAGLALMVWMIELALQRHRVVRVRNLPGNHDPHASLLLTIGLSAFFSGQERVIVDETPGEFWFHEWGACLFGAHHGHKAPPARLAQAMAAWNREAWGRTKFSHFYTGHVHHKSAQEVGDVMWESFGTLAAKDAYAKSNAYVSSRSAVSLIFDREKGEIARNMVRL